jgi:hypothetical protein
MVSRVIHMVSLWSCVCSWLNLAGNMLSGSIPVSMSRMISSLSLYLCNNNFSGVYPSQVQARAFAYVPATLYDALISDPSR